MSKIYNKATAVVMDAGNNMNVAIFPIPALPYHLKTSQRWE